MSDPQQQERPPGLLDLRSFAKAIGVPDVDNTGTESLRGIFRAAGIKQDWISTGGKRNREWYALSRIAAEAAKYADYARAVREQADRQRREAAAAGRTPEQSALLPPPPADFMVNVLLRLDSIDARLGAIEHRLGLST